MATVLAVLTSALATPAIKDAGSYLVQTLAPIAGRLAPLADNLPVTMGSNERALLLASYGLIQYVIGAQSGEQRPLEMAATAYRRAAMEWTRERVPLGWAAMQNALGDVLAKQGDRERATLRIEEAVAAYRQALRDGRGKGRH